ncbi:MAG: phosphopantothenoylcysteine decarboxylase [Planctomycetaceae bacterium]|nr:phosphopantothenoylcysteine decarboxylase [Planctomycetaceae bacterium]
MHILLGITGGIAAYKSADLVSRLVQANYEVSVIMTRSATQLVCPKTFEALSGRPVHSELFVAERAITHIRLSQEANLFCVAPASANFLAKAATGIADDLLSTIYLSFVGPVLFAPAMNTAMWEKAAVQRNVRQLMKDGVRFIGPETGRLSCGEVGAGRMSEPEEIFKQIVKKLEV